MPVTDDLQLPIRRTSMSGPAIDALASRKETNNNSRVTAAELRAGYEKVKDGLFDGLKSLAEAMKQKR